MMAPAGLVGATLALWGISIGVPWLGALAAVAFESLRLAAPLADAARFTVPVVRASALFALAALGYPLLTQSLPQSLYSGLRWLPLALLAIPALQVLAARLPLASLRRALRPRDGGAPADDRETDSTHAYAALTLAAAGTGQGAQAWLYAGFALIVGWALLARLPRGRRSRAAMLFVLAAGIGQATHMGIAALQGQVEEWSTEILADFFSPKADPFRERTRIGDLGRIKLSDRIVMRVQVEGPRPDALLLRESAYERYRGGEWQSARREGRPAVREGDRWTLSDGSAPSRLALRRALPGGEGLLPLPLGTRSVDNLPAHAVEVFASGTVRARGTPRYLALGVAYDEGAEHDAPDAASDLEVPELVAGTFARVIEEERLRQPSPAATIDAVREFFDAKFSYSLELGEARSGAGGRTLADFLLRDRRGHCEYFATATVLLLRQAGIPARYVGGYSAQEYSVLEKAFVVRARHAHAWAIAWLDGRWVNLDTTPSRWAEFEGAAARGVLAPLLDRLSWMLERLLQAWMALSSGEIALIGAGVAAVLLLAPALVLAIRRRRARAPRHRRIDSDEVTLAWLRVERSVVRAGHGRAPGETARAWARRLADAGSGQAWRARLVALARDYYRARFDPAASPAQARAFLLAARGWKMTP